VALTGGLGVPGGAAEVDPAEPDPIIKGSLKYWAMACFTPLLWAEIHMTRKNAIMAVTKSA
jgi:hypothetical protein